MAAEEGEDAFFDQFRDEYDSFFDNEGASSPPTGTTSSAALAGPSGSEEGAPKVNEASGNESAPPPRGQMPHGASSSDATAGPAEATGIESEYEILSSYTPEKLPNGTSSGSCGHHAPAEEKAQPTANGHAPTEFSMADSDDEAPVEMDMVQSGFHQNLCLPELPAAPVDFSRADLALREALAAFYTKHCAERLPAVNAIVERYRGRAVPTLWAQLALKYSVPAAEAVELLAGTLYLNSAFEHSDEQLAVALDVQLGRLQIDALDEQAELVREALEEGARGSSEELLRALCFRGPAGDLGDVRPLVWKVLLGYLPMTRHSEWSAIESERRALYATYRSEVLVVTSSHKIEVKVGGHHAMKTLDVLQQIQKDVERTRHECDSFRRPATRAALSALLFVYAHRNPDTQYIQGMNEVAALLYHVLSVDPESAEADTFWCLCAVMREIKEGLMQALEPSSGSGIAGQQPAPSLVASVERLLKVYDPELFRHLQKSGCPLSVFTFRWCALLFAQDAALPDAVNLFECLIADPQRFDFVVHISLALLLERRDDLLCTQEQGDLAEVLRAAPRSTSVAAVLRLARAVCAFERRPQNPPFPVRSAAQLVQDLSGWATKLGAGVARSLQDSVAPVVKDKAGQAAGRAGAAAKGGAQAVKEWLEQDKPIQPETIEKATAQVASLWQAVRSRGAAAVSKTKALAAEYSQADRWPASGAGAAEGSAGAFSSAAASSAAAGERQDPALGGGLSNGYHGQRAPS